MLRAWGVLAPRNRAARSCSDYRSIGSSTDNGYGTHDYASHGTSLQIATNDYNECYSSTMPPMGILV